jgi:NAD(P)-dependent dehydrogenase (short-subunit alcohol dehydrogenase family)
VVVTGATSGIGLASVLELARAGYDAIGTARTEDKAELLRETAEREGLVVRTVVADLTDDASTRRAFEEVAALTAGGPWAVVNNAGFAQAGAIEDVDDVAARHQLEINLLAPARIARLVLPAMRQRGDGRIVNVSSVSARVSSPFLGWYVASKMGLEGVTDALRMEVAPFGIKVVLVEPGPFRSEIWERGLASLPAVADSPYARWYDVRDDLRAHTDSLPLPTAAARTVRRALDARRPRPRYLVGPSARRTVLFETLTPTVASDYAKSVVTGLRTPPARLTRLVRVGKARRSTGD